MSSRGHGGDPPGIDMMVCKQSGIQATGSWFPEGGFFEFSGWVTACDSVDWLKRLRSGEGLQTSGTWLPRDRTPVTSMLLVPMWGRDERLCILPNKSSGGVQMEMMDKIITKIR